MTMPAAGPLYPRLFVYIAREASTAVVLRRGPSDWTRLSLWDTSTDTFEHGQWLKGRVYERRSDISPDGRLFAGFIRQSGLRHGNPNADTWIALSRPPYFTALAVWFVGGTYHTGAFFPRADSLWLGFQAEMPPDVGSLPAWLTLVPPREVSYVEDSTEWTERTVHFNRLLRDGWELLDKTGGQTRWRRPHPTSTLALHMTHTFEAFTVPGGPYVVDYSVRDEANHREWPIGIATWADWDQRGRLIVAREGQICTWDAASGALRTLADFTAQHPDPQPAPDEAAGWFSRA
jgi:hypothetical protein